MLLLPALAGAGSRAPHPSSSRVDTVRLTLLGTTDVHGHLLPYDYATGRPARTSLAQIATLVDSVRRRDPDVLLLDSGDLLQGTPLDEYVAETDIDSIHPVIAAMNVMGYDASAIGNHEYNYGLPFLRRALSGARFPFLAANVYRADSDSLVHPPYVIREVGGVRVGILGFTTPGVALWDREHVEGRRRFTDIVSAARRWLPRLRREHPDLVVALVHSGLGPGSSYGESAGVPEENAVRRLAEQVPGLDVIFAGHTHVRVDGIRIGGALVLQAGRFADALAVAHVTLRRRAGTGWKVLGDTGELLDPSGEPADPAVRRAVLPAHRATVEWLYAPLAYTPDRWSTALGRLEDVPAADLITAAERQATGAELASTAIFTTRVRFGPGPITRRDVLSLYVYPNTLRVVKLSGDGLRAYLERSARYYRGWPAPSLANDSVPGYDLDLVSGVDYRIDLRRPPGRRVVELRYRGRPVVSTDSFTLAVSNYRAAGGGGYDMLPGAPVVYRSETPVTRTIADFLRARDTLRIADVHRTNWRLEPPEAVRTLEERREARPAGS